MIIEDESGRDLEILTPEVASSSSSGMRRGFTFANLTRETALIEDIGTYYNLRDDLVQYLWKHKVPNSFSIETYMKLMQHCFSSSGRKFFPFRFVPPAIT